MSSGDLNFRVSGPSEQHQQPQQPQHQQQERETSADAKTRPRQQQTRESARPSAKTQAPEEAGEPEARAMRRPARFLASPAPRTRTDTRNSLVILKQQSLQATGSLLFLMLIITLSSASPPPPQMLAQRHQQQQPQTSHTCEGDRMELSCPEGKVIHLARANYGRFSQSICNELSLTNYSTSCFLHKSFLIIEDRCNKLRNCSAFVSNDLFGQDPCEGTMKYLEVQFYCDDATGSPPLPANKINPPQVTLPQQQQPAAATPTQSPSAAHKSPGQPAASAPEQVGGQQPQQAAGERRPPIESSQPEQPAEDTSQIWGGQWTPTQQPTVIQQQQQQLLCPQIVHPRGVRWNATRAGQLAWRACPEGASGRASWLCDRDKLRFTPLWSPDFSQCKSNWLQRQRAQLERFLEAPAKLAGQRSPLQEADFWRKQSEQLLRVVLNEMTLLAHSKDLYSEDLKLVDQMLGQIIGQVRANQISLARLSAATSGNQFAPEEDLFELVVRLVSSLFEPAQRQAWLEVQPAELRPKLELRLLGHLRDSGIMLAQSGGSAALWRQPNVLAAVVAVTSGAGSRNGARHANQLELVLAEGGHFRLQVARPRESPLQLYGQQLDDSEQIASQLDELRLDGQLVKTLSSQGVTKLLVLDVKRPDYSLIRTHLDAGAATLTAASSNNIDDLNSRPLGVSMISNFANNMENDLTLSARLFGLFPIGSGQSAAANSPGAAAPSQNLFAAYMRRIDSASYFPNRPIQIDFKIATDGIGRTSPVGQPFKSCESINILSAELSGAEDQQFGTKCSLTSFNATNYVCQCDRFGFIALVNLPQTQLDTQWLMQQFAAAGDNSIVPTAAPALDLAENQADLARFPLDANSPAYINAPPGGHQQQSRSVTATVLAAFIVIGISLLVIVILVLLVAAVLRAANAHSQLSKKQGFLSAGAIFGPRAGRANGPTSGPFAESYVVSNGSPIIGLNGASSHPGSTYKGQQQLYAAHLPSMDDYGSPTTTTTASYGAGGLRHWLPRRQWAANLLRPSRWLSALTARGDPSKGDRVIQHRVIGSALNAAADSLGSVTYKSQYQNGYTTNHLHQASQMNNPIVAPSSSTSSYVSTSAYYEEIGPGNLTKVNPNHFNTTNPNSPLAQRQDQQLLSSGMNAHNQPTPLHHNHLSPQQQHLPQQHNPNWPPQTTTAISYPIEHQLHYGQPMTFTSSNTMMSPNHRLYNSGCHLDLHPRKTLK